MSNEHATTQVHAAAPELWSRRRLEIYAEQAGQGPTCC